MLTSLLEATGCDLELRIHQRPPRARLNGPIGRRLLKQRAQLLQTVEQYGVQLLGVFGSVARSQETTTSDVNLLVTLPRGMGLIGMGRVANEFSELLGATVDLIPDDSLKTGVRKNVLETPPRQLERIIRDCLDRGLFTLDEALARLDQPDMAKRMGAQLVRAALPNA